MSTGKVMDVCGLSVITKGAVQIMKRFITGLTLIGLVLVTGIFSAAAQQDDPPRATPLVCDAFAGRSTADRVNYYLGEGIAYYYAGEFRRAENSLSCIVEQIDPRSAAAFAARGQVYMAQRDFIEAAEDFGSAVNLDQTLAGALNNRGVALASRGLTARALEDFNAALSANSALLEARINRAILRSGRGDFVPAIAELEEVIAAAGLDSALADLRRPNRPANAPLPDYNPVYAQAYVILGIVQANYARASFQNYLDLTARRNVPPDTRVQSAAGALASRTSFDLNLSDGSYYLTIDFIAASRR
jgi:tetratricopeptide (TPR) repeat protein